MSKITEGNRIWSQLTTHVDDRTIGGAISTGRSYFGNQSRHLIWISCSHAILYGSYIACIISTLINCAWISEFVHNLLGQEHAISK